MHQQTRQRNAPRDRPSRDDWLAALPYLKKRGSEYVGPCPVCGGDDRFRINDKGAFCRKECAYPDLLKATGLSTNDDVHPGHWYDRQRPPAPKPVPNPSPDPKPEKTTLAMDLWTACVDATGTPAHTYLTGRHVWPPVGDGFPVLPDTVGWLDTDTVEDWQRRKGWPGLPREAAGAFVCVYRLPSAETASAVSLEALTADGKRLRPERWRRTFGERKGAHFAAAPGDGKRLVIAEGEVTALACAWLYPGRTVWAVGGTAGLAAFVPPDDTDMLIEVDGDKKGRNAAAELVKRLAKRGGIFVSFNPPDTDAADTLAVSVLERAAIREQDDRPWALATVAAWHDLITAESRHP